MLAWIGWLGVGFLVVGVVYGLGAWAQPKILAKLRNLVIALGCFGVGFLGVGLRLALRSCEAFARPTLVAEVRCQWVGPNAFDVVIAPVRDGTRQAPQTFRLTGDQWTISGGIVKWHPWLTALGLRSYHKLSRISGRFAKTAEETAQPPTAFDLGGGLDRTWWWLYRLDPFLPFVEASYGSTAFAYVDPAFLFDVFVTPSGYLIQHTRLAPRSPRR